MTNSRAVFLARFHACWTSKLRQEAQYLASILPNTFVKCIRRNISCAPGKWCLHASWNFTSTFTELHVHGDERWPMEVTTNTYFRWPTEVTSNTYFRWPTEVTSNTYFRGIRGRCFDRFVVSCRLWRGRTERIVHDCELVLDTQLSSG